MFGKEGVGGGCEGEGSVFWSNSRIGRTVKGLSCGVLLLPDEARVTGISPGCLALEIGMFGGWMGYHKKFEEIMVVNTEKWMLQVTRLPSRRGQRNRKINQAERKRIRIICTRPLRPGVVAHLAGPPSASLGDRQ